MQSLSGEPFSAFFISIEVRGFAHCEQAMNHAIAIMMRWRMSTVDLKFLPASRR